MLRLVMSRLHSLPPLLIASVEQAGAMVLLNAQVAIWR
jgi:hypothetical protein